jgi:MFS family permease
MFCLYSVGFAVSTASVMTQAAAQVVLTQVVSRDRLVEANAKNALAASVAMLLGPPLAGTLIRLVSAPVAMLMTAILLLASAAIRRGLSINETPVLRHRDYWRAIHEGFRFVWSQALLVTMVVCVGLWQFCSQAATSVQILFATRLLGLSERGIGVSYTAGGIGVIAASTAGPRLAKHYGSGPVLALGFCICGTGWLLLASAPTGPLGMAAYPVMHFAYGVGAGFILVNFLALRQSATPSWMLSRMTSTMRWLMLVPAVPGALWGGWLAQHLGLRATLGLSGVASILLGSICGRLPAIRLAKSLPNPSTVSATIRSEQYPAD